MRSTTSFRLLMLLAAMSAGTAVAGVDDTAPTEGPGAQAARDAREPQVLAECPHGLAKPPKIGPGFASEMPPASDQYEVSAIAGVIKAGVHWKVIWQTTGNNADGIIGLPNGNILNAQNNNSAVVEITPQGKEKVVYTDTNTGGALSMNSKGQLFVAERGLRASIWQLAPERKMLANEYEGGSLDCLGGVLNDIAADSKGGVYFSQGGVYYAAPDGKVSAQGQDLFTNGIVLSRDEKTLYVTNAGTVVALDVQPDGSLTNQRVFAELPGRGGDGMTIDAQGRLYVPGGPGVRVIAADGKYLGTIPAPVYLTSVSFGGPKKKTLFAVGQPGLPGMVQQAHYTPHPQILAIPMEAQGYLQRAK